MDHEALVCCSDINQLQLAMESLNQCNTATEDYQQSPVLLVDIKQRTDFI
jgi:hypothetical protein